MDISVLVSTMDNEISLVNKMNISSNYVVVNQTQKMGEIPKFKSDTKKIWLDSKTKGLSISRNLAISLSSSELSLIADDDMRYVDQYEAIVEMSFKENPNHDIIIFQVNNKEKTYKQYSDKEYEVGYIDALKVSSVQMAFRTQKIKEKVIFNEQFGSGARYKMGEENIFLFDAIRQGFKIKYIPKQIAVLKLGNSTWFTGYNEEYLFNRGASFYAMSPGMHLPLIIQYAIRKRNLFKKIPFIKLITIQLDGKNHYKKSIK